LPLPTLSSIKTDFLFSPHANGSRPISIDYYLHKSDGTIVVRSISLQGTGIQPPPIGMSLAANTFSATAGQEIHFPVMLLDSSYVNVKAIQFTLGINSDLLSPERIDLSNGVLSDATIQTFAVAKDSVSVILQLPTARHLSPGSIADIVCKTYVTDTTATEVNFLHFSIDDSLQTASCLPLSQPTTVTIPFTLLPECGTNIITEFLHDGTTSLKLVNLVPNPAHSELTISIMVNPQLSNELLFEVINDAGVILQQEQMTVAAATTISKTINLLGPSGGRTLRIKNGRSEVTQRFILTR
jgi:hypothetical protein